MKYLKMYENFGMEIDDDSKLGKTSFVLMSLDEKYYIMHKYRTWGGGRSNDYSWLTPHLSEDLTVTIISGVGYETEKEATTHMENLNSGEILDDEFSTHGAYKPIGYVMPGPDTFNTTLLQIEGWKVVPFFVGAYRLDKDL